ncbi:MAG TPA: lipopolysaccharide heptosyltransferase I [Burkholderiales bacterium]|nr:lipopolysaccharide heptosyltransferase I [Burkholderiales bacterium]
MRRILLVKTSSLGDVVHNLPVATDLRTRYPDVEIDWAVEETFGDIPALHPAVSQVIRVAPRRWRRAFAGRETWREIGELRRTLAARGYDAVIDTQGLIKSALITRLAPGRRFGLDWVSAREPLWPFYHRTFRVSWAVHAVERNRQLAASALGYALPSGVHYGIETPSFTRPAGLQPGDYAVLLHATSAWAKLWPEHEWVKLGDHLHHRGLQLVLPWGSDRERRRSEHIAALLQHSIVPPRLSLRQVAGLLGQAQVVFGVDTGLTHLAVALGTRTIGIYCATDPAATGLYGSASAVNVGGKNAPPGAEAVISAWRQPQPEGIGIGARP